MININPIYLQELREKNWKAMDAVSASEKQHKVELGKAVQSIKVNKTSCLLTWFKGCIGNCHGRLKHSFKSLFL